MSLSLTQAERAERIANSQAVLERHREEQRAKRSSSRATGSPVPSHATAAGSDFGVTAAPPATPQRAVSSYASASPGVQRTSTAGTGSFSSWYAAKGPRQSYSEAPHAGASEWNRRQAPLTVGSGAGAVEPVQYGASWPATQEHYLASQQQQVLPSSQPSTHVQPASPAPWQPAHSSQSTYAAAQAARSPPAASPAQTDERAYLEQLLGRLDSSNYGAAEQPALAPAPQQPQPQPQPQPHLQSQPQRSQVGDEGVPPPTSTNRLAQEWGEAVAAVARPHAEEIHRLSREELKHLYKEEVARQLHAIGGDEDQRMKKAHELLKRSGSAVVVAQKPVGVWGNVAARSDLSKNDVVAIVELLEAQLAEKEQRLRALGEKLETAKEQPEPAPEPAPEPPPPQRAPTPPVEPEEVYDMPLHPAASAESLGRHLARFCQRGSTLVSRDGLIQALQSLPDTDRAKRMVHKVLRIFDRPDFVDEGGYGSTDIHQKLVSAHAAADLTKLIVLLAHGEHREHVNFALSAVNAPKGLPPAVSSELAKKALDVAATMFGDDPDDPRGRAGIDAAIKRHYAGVGQIAYTEFRHFCHDDEFLRTHCFGDTTVVDAKAHLRDAAFMTGDKWGGIASAAQLRRH